MTRLFRLQPAAYADQIKDGHEMVKQPYPFYVRDDGRVTRQDFWRGDPALVVGFARDLAVHEVSLWWESAMEDLSTTVGMYLVTANSEGTWSTHTTAIAKAEMVEDPGNG